MLCNQLQSIGYFLWLSPLYLKLNYIKVYVQEQVAMNQKDEDRIERNTQTRRRVNVFL